MIGKLWGAVGGILLTTLLACGDSATSATSPEAKPDMDSSSALVQPTENKLSEQEKKDGWKLLFDGKSTDGWHVYNKGITPSAWTAQNGALFCNPEDTSETADLVSDQAYENYEFAFDWKLAKEGNSGVFINVVEQPDLPIAWASGPEYQLLEKSHVDFAKPEKRAGCLYGFAPQKTAVDTKAPGEWNHSLIRQQNGKVSFYLNGTLTAEEDFTAEAWRDKVANSGFKSYPLFGKATKGHLVLQDWASGVWFSNLKIREL